jgi:hypothetical protein
MFLFCLDGNGRPQTAVPEAVKMYDRQMAEGGEDEGQRKPSKNKTLYALCLSPVITYV